MDEHEENFKDIFRYTDVEYTPDGYTDVYRWDEWESDRIDLYTPQDCFGFSEPFAGRVEYSEKKPEIAAKAKPDPADLGRRASVAAGATIRDGVDGGGIKL